MKRFLNIIRLAVVIVAVGSCTKEEGLVPQLNRSRIAFSVNDPDITFDTQTRATAVTGSTIEANGFYCSATTSGEGGDVSAWNSVSFAKSGDYYVSDKVWPTSDPSFSFQASNVPVTHGSSGCTVEASNTTDVVCAYVASPTYKSPSVLTFEHIFARIGNVTVSAVGGYTITGVSLTITPRTGGTYNIKTGVGQTDATGWSSLTTGSATTIFSGSTGTVSNDLYLVPGTYDLSFSWTATKGDYSANLSTTVSGTFSRGCVSTVTAGLTGDADDIVFNVSVNSWTVAGTNDMGTLKGEIKALKFENNGSTDANISLSNKGGNAPVLEYSTDGSSWTSWDYSPIAVAPGNCVYIRGNNPSGFSSSNSDYSRFIFDGGSIACHGDIMTLIDYTTEINIIPNNYCFYSLFSFCTSLTTAPELPATTLATRCYQYMFYGCTSLTTAPELPATTLANVCYGRMFSGCTSLTSAPELPATTLVNDCYYYMFYGCEKLNYIKAMFTTTPSSTYTNNWVNGVAASGTFVKNSAATWDVTGVYGVPSGWTVQTYTP